MRLLTNDGARDRAEIIDDLGPDPLEWAGVRSEITDLQ